MTVHGIVCCRSAGAASAQPPGNFQAAPGASAGHQRKESFLDKIKRAASQPALAGTGMVFDCHWGLAQRCLICCKQVAKLQLPGTAFSQMQASLSLTSTESLLDLISRIHYEMDRVFLHPEMCAAVPAMHGLCLLRKPQCMRSLGREQRRLRWHSRPRCCMCLCRKCVAAIAVAHGRCRHCIVDSRLSDSQREWGVLR